MRLFFAINRQAPFWLAFLWTLALTACMRPVDSDFGDRRQGLADDELLWIERLPGSVVQSWQERLSAADSATIRRYNAAFFTDCLPLIIRDLLEGELPAYADFTPSETNRPLEDLREKLKQLGGTMQNYGPLVRLAELVSVVPTDANAFRPEAKFLRLYWTDAAGLSPDRFFAGVMVADLDDARYTFEVDGERTDPGSFFGKSRYFALPVYLRTNTLEYSLRSAAEAAYVRERVRAGAWGSIEWVENGINISGKEKIRMAPEAVLAFAGVYAFPGDSAGKGEELFLTAEKDYLVADWTHRFRTEKLLAWSDSAFFSHSGDLYFFENERDSVMAVEVISGGDTLSGLRAERASGD